MQKWQTIFLPLLVFCDVLDDSQLGQMASNMYSGVALMHIVKVRDQRDPDCVIWFAQDGNGAIWKLDLSFMSNSSPPQRLYNFHAGFFFTQRLYAEAKASNLSCFTFLPSRSLRLYSHRSFWFLHLFFALLTPMTLRTACWFRLQACRFAFLVADTQLYERLFPSVGPSVCRRAWMEKWKNERFEAFCVCFCVGKGVGCGWGLAAPAHPSATILRPRITCYQCLSNHWYIIDLVNDYYFSPCHTYS